MTCRSRSLTIPHAVRSTRSRWLRLMALVAGAMVAVATPARAVVIQTASGTDNTTAPVDDPGFGNVGYTANGLGTAIYLGEGWVLTAGHVGGEGSGIVLASGTYMQASGSNTGFTLVNTTAGKTAFTDLYMYKLATEPIGLPTLQIASSAPLINAAVTMVGGGLDRGPFQEWLVNTSTTPWVWTTTGSGGNFAGYGTLGTRAIRWGTNEVAFRNFWVQVDYGGGPNDVRSLATEFDANPGSTEAQAVLRDSGGAVFTKVGGQWELAGVMYTVGGFSGQPDPSQNPVFGNRTYIADLSYYRPQIVAAIPEPSAAALAGGAAGTLAWVMWHRRRRLRSRRQAGAET